MDNAATTPARQIAEAALAFEKRRTGHPPRSVTVVLSEDTVVITLRGALSEAEMALSRSPAATAQLRDFHRQLFAASSESLQQEIHRITGVGVAQASAEVETQTGAVMQWFATGTVVQVFLLAGRVPADTWSGGSAGKQP